MENKYKIKFRLIQDENGYPPFGNEYLWAKSTNNRMEYIIDNIPFYSSDVSLGDLVLVHKNQDDLSFLKVLVPSGNSTIRIYCPIRDIFSRLKIELVQKECSWEGSNLDNLISVNIPPKVDINHIIELINKLKESCQEIEYEDGCIQHSNYHG